MPRVTEEHRAGRRAEILTAAARLFAANGFHATSMADIISESGLSAGAVYRYFRSKEELIAAVAETALSAADEAFDKLLADNAVPSPAQAVTALIGAIAGRIAHDPATGVDLTRIGVQVWAEQSAAPTWPPGPTTSTGGYEVTSPRSPAAGRPPGTCRRRGTGAAGRRHAEPRAGLRAAAPAGQRHRHRRLPGRHDGIAFHDAAQHRRSSPGEHRPHADRHHVGVRHRRHGYVLMNGAGPAPRLGDGPAPR